MTSLHPTAAWHKQLLLAKTWPIGKATSESGPGQGPGWGGGDRDSWVPQPSPGWVAVLDVFPRQPAVCKGCACRLGMLWRQVWQ